MSISDPIQLGVAGLGRGFMLTLPSLRADPHVKLVACAAPRPNSRAAFLDAFGGRAYETVSDLVRDPHIEAVYIATPHQMHKEHAIAAATAGKHILVEKPLAISLEDADAIVSAADTAGVHLITGPGHSFDPPVLLARDLIRSGKFGAVRMVQIMTYTDFLYRPRRPEELVTDLGGGVVFSQAIHQIDMVRALIGHPARRVTALTGIWDPDRATEGAYSALIEFDGGAFANLTYSGYGHYNSDTMMGWIGELGHPSSPDEHGTARRALTEHPDINEAAAKTAKTFGAAPQRAPAPHNEHFGPVVISCDRADLRLTPDGVEIWGDVDRRFETPAPTPSPRSPVLSGVYDAIRHNHPPFQSGIWGRDSLALCHAILTSANTRQSITLARS